MQYPIQIEQQNGHYHASVLTVPSLTQVAPTRDEVLRLIRNDLLEYVNRIDIVYMEVPVSTPIEGNSSDSDHWLNTAGIFADDESLIPMLDEIYAERNDE